MRPCLPWLLLAALLLSGCAERANGPVFRDEAGGAQPLRNAGEGRFSLRRLVTIEGTDRAFYLRYGSTSGTVGELRVLDKAGTTLAARGLLAASTEISLLVPLPAGARVAGFALDPAPGQAPGPASGPKPLEAGVTRSLAGFERGDGRLRLGTGVTGLTLAPDSAEVDLDRDVFGDDRRWRLELEFSLTGPAEDGTGQEGAPGRRVRARLELAAGSPSSGARAVFELDALPGPQRLFLYPATVGFAPARVTLRPDADSLLELERLTIVPRLEAGAVAAGALEPIPADPGTVLLYDPRYWRRPEFELFAWERVPGVLILDTADYAVQNRFFKRLAFFVEKIGYRGRLVTEEEVRGRHGFNAHDYRAEDLARFYNQAAAESFALTREELLLRDLLLANGILRRGGSLEAGEGAILSISRSSDGALRRHLLTHEVFHGLYFTLPRYREACQEAWRALSEPELKFWRLFLRWGAYDFNDEYLAANELQAYLFQQPREELGFYFGRLTAGRLSRAYPEAAGWIRAFLAEQPDSFQRSYDRLAPVLRREAWLEGGRVVELERREP